MSFSSDVGPCRNEQCGDWSFDAQGNVAVRSVKLSDSRYEFLIQLHELIEAMLCKQAGITDEEVTAFDKLFEEEREAGKHSDVDEDGDDPRAPYRHQHQVATLIERLLAKELDVNWKTYEQEIYSHE